MSEESTGILSVIAVIDHAADELDTFSADRGHGSSQAAADLRASCAELKELIDAAQDVIDSEPGFEDFDRLNDAIRRARGNP